MRVHARTVSYFLSVIAIAAVFFSVEHFFEKFFFHDDDLIDIISAICAAVSFSEFRRFFDRATDRIFSRGPRDERAGFFANVSHELQTPIAIVRGNVEILQSASASESQRAAAERVIVSTLDGMSRLIGNVLASARLKSEREHLAIASVPVRDLIAEVCDDCAVLAEDRGIRIVIRDPCDTPAVFGDRDRLKEVLLNLVSNAFKHTPRGGSIGLWAFNAGREARIVVEDSGSGIARGELPYIFDRFYRIAAERDTVSGTGIGLSICREIIRAHGGTIRAESEPGKGSRFIISLPLAPPHPPDPSPGRAATASAIINS